MPAADSRWVCDLQECGKTFSSSSHLRRHQRVHVSVRPYPCPRCPKSFTRKELLDRHAGIHAVASSSVKPSPPLAEEPPDTTLPLALGPTLRLSTANGVLAPSDAMTANDGTGAAGLTAYSAQPPGNIVYGQPSMAFDNDIDAEVFQWLDQMMFEGVQPETGTLRMDMAGLTSDTLNTNTVVASNFRLSAPTALPTSVINALLSSWRRFTCISAEDVDRLGEYYQAGWDACANRFPVIHFPSFQVETALPALTTSIILCGALFSDDRPNQAFAQSLAPTARALIALETPETAMERLQINQAYVILAAASEDLEETDQHLSHGLSSFAMTLMRRFGYLNTVGQGYPTGNGLEEQWNTWIIEETKRRLIWVCLMLDIRSNVFGHHLGSRARSPFRINVGLPCENDCWAAPDALAWARQLHDTETLPAVMKKALATEAARGEVNDERSEFTRLTIILSITALAWDINHRDTIVPPELGSGGISRVNITILRYLTSLGKPRSSSLFGVEASGSAAVGALKLLVDLASLEVFAGVDSVGILAPVMPAQRIDSNRKIRVWAQSPSALQATAIAAQHLATAFENANTWPWSLLHCASVYFAFLTVWACLTCRAGAHSTPLLSRAVSVTPQGGRSPQTAYGGIDWAGLQYASEISFCNDVVAFATAGGMGSCELSRLDLLCISISSRFEQSRTPKVQSFARILRKLTKSFAPSR